MVLQALHSLQMTMILCVSGENFKREGIRLVFFVELIIDTDYGASR
jgi:hypothetical protein